MDERQSVTRRFNLVDGMIAVAASGVMLGLARFTVPVINDFRRAYYILNNLATMRRFYVLQRLIVVQRLEMKIISRVELIILVWLFAFAAMRLRRPRQPLRVVSLQPGMVALWAAAAPFALGLVLGLFSDGTSDSAGVQVVACLSVPFAWRALKESGCWHPEACWVDRFGRALGICWWAVAWIGAMYLLFLTAMWDTPGFIFMAHP